MLVVLQFVESLEIIPNTLVEGGVGTGEDESDVVDGIVNPIGIDAVVS